MLSNDKITLSPMNGVRESQDIAHPSSNTTDAVNSSKLLKVSNDSMANQAAAATKPVGNQSMRSRRSRASVPPGSIIDSSNRAAQLVFKYISDNEHRQLEAMLTQEKENIDVTLLKESRMYTALSFAAFKNHLLCFKLIYQHALRYNVAGGERAKERAKTAV